MASAEGASVLISGVGLHLHMLHHVNGPAIDYVGVVVAAFASWVGVPGPGEPVVIAAGVFASRHKLDISPVLLAAWVGASAGGIVGWLVGMKAGRSVLTARGPLLAMRLRAVTKGEEVFRRMQVVAILVTPSWVAGINRAGTGVYLTVNAASAALWAVGIGLGAYYIGPPVLDFANDAGVIASAVVVLLVGGAVVAEILRRRRRRVRARGA
jgi:membrane protein DedA with SNARE-associated domain